MLAVFQRVNSAICTVDEVTSGEIGQGVLLFLGVEKDDTVEHAAKMARKVAQMRVFRDENDKMNRSVLDIGGSVLLISNFTLCANCSHGRRPDFMNAARPEEAKALYEAFISFLKQEGVTNVQLGQFGEHMHILADNDGPVTLILDTRDWM